MKDESGWAFPHHEVWDDDKTDVGWIGGGLTKREYFAALAMQGLLAGIYSDENMLKEFKNQTGRDYVSENAISYADALLKALGEK